MEADSQEMYDQAVAEQTENPPETPVEAPTEAKAERLRDERGKFVKANPEPISEEAPVSTDVETQPQAETKTESDAKVPSWRLAEEADRRRQAEQALTELRNEIRQMQLAMFQQQKPPEPQAEAPDIFADPQGFVQSLESKYENRLKQMQLENSLRFAHYSHGDKFTEAYNNFMDYIAKSRDQASYQRVMASNDPGNALVEWYTDQELRKELGGTDLRAFLEKQKEEWLKDPSIQAKAIEAYKASQQAQPTNNINLPPSLSKVSAAKSAHDMNVASGQDMYSYATAKR